MASRYCRFASKYCRIAGVAPAGSEDTGGDAISRELAEREYNIGGNVIILALDTTTRAGSVGSRDATASCWPRSSAIQRCTHGERLPARPHARARRGERSICAAVDALCRRRGPGLVHGPARRHRHDAGARDGGRARVVAGLDARRARASGDATAPGPSAHGWTRSEAKCSPRCMHRTGATSASRPMSGTPGAVLEAWLAAARGAARYASSATARVRYRDVVGTNTRRSRRGRRPAAACRPHRPDCRGGARARGPAARRDADLRPQVRRRADARSPRSAVATNRCSRMPRSNSLRPQEDLDAVAALEADTFANPVDPRDARARARQADVMRVYVLRTPEKRVAAFCACWFIVDEAAHQHRRRRSRRCGAAAWRRRS